MYYQDGSWALQLKKKNLPNPPSTYFFQKQNVLAGLID